MEGKEFEGLPRKRLSLGWIEMEQSQALNGLDRRQGMFFLRSKSRCSENRKGRRDCDQKAGCWNVNSDVEQLQILAVTIGIEERVI